MKDNKIHTQDAEADIEKYSYSQIKKGAILSYAAILIDVILGLVYTPWMLKMIGDGDYGLYSVSTSLIALFAVDFGLSAGVSRFMAKYCALRDEKTANNFLGLIYKLYLIITAIIFCILIVLYFRLGMIYTGFTGEELHKFKIIYIITAFSTLINFPFITLNGILTAYEKFFVLKLSGLIGKILMVSLTIVALFLGSGVYALVGIQAFSSLVIIGIKLVILHKDTNLKVNWLCKDRVLLKEIFSFSVWSTVGNIAQRFVFNIMPTILAMVSNTLVITRFALASTIEGYVWRFSEALNGLFLPKVSRIVNKEDEQDVLPLMIKVGRINLTIISALICGFIILGKSFISCWIGGAYQDVYLSVIFLIIPSFISQPQQIANTTIIALNKVKIQAIIMSIGSVINIILSYFLAKWIGAVGAAISICLVFFLRIIGMNIVYQKELKLNLLAYFKQCHFKMMPAIILSFILGMGVQYLMPLSGWTGLFLSGICYCLIYFSIMWIMGWNPNEKSMIISIMKSCINMKQKE